MKRIIFVFLFSFITGKSFSPTPIYNIDKGIEMTKTFAKYIDLLSLQYAFSMVESKENIMAYNLKEDAAGILQIRPIMLNHVNSIQDSIKFTLIDRFNKERSLKMFTIVMLNHNPNLDIYKACVIWNGKNTTPYYVNNVKRFYNIKKKELTKYFNI